MSLKEHYSWHLTMVNEPLNCDRFDPVSALEISVNASTHNILDSSESEPVFSQLGEAAGIVVDTQSFNESVDLLNDNLSAHDEPRSVEGNVGRDEITNIYSNMYVRLETQHFATEPLIQDIVKSTSFAHSKCHERFSTSLSKCCLSDRDKKIVTKILNESFNKITECHDPKTGIFRRTYIRHKFYHSNPRYIKSAKAKLCDEQGNKTEQYYSYVPPLETLKLMLENDEVRQLCDARNYGTVGDGYFDVLNGDVIKNNPFFIMNKDGLMVVHFQDAFNICCPLGAAKTTYKIVGIYMMLETEGIIFSASGTVMNRKGTLVAMIGDNLGSHDVDRFTRNFSTVQYFSRYCESTLQELRHNFFIAGKMRTRDSYDANAAESIRTGQMIKGVHSKSKLNELDFYHVIPGLPPCIAHDIFEGIGPSDLWLAISYFIEKKWIRPGILNLRLKSVALSGYQRLSLPQIKFGPKLSKKITALSPAQVELVKDGVNDYIHLRKTCFPHIPPKPKHGYIQRYFELIQIFGPLKHYWTLRFESKYKPFKDMIKFCRNFKDVTGTLSEKPELLQSAQENQYHEFAEPVDPVNFSIDELRKSVKCLPTNGGLNEPEVDLMCQDVHFSGIRYTKNMSVCTGMDDIGNLILCQILMILIDKTRKVISFVGQTFTVKYNIQTGYNECVRDISGIETFCFPHSSLLSADPIIQSYVQSMKVYVTKYAPYDKDPNKRRTIEIVNFNDSSVADVLDKASDILGITGVSIVLESDGTVIDNVRALQDFQTEKLIILEQNESYRERNIESPTTHSQSELPLQDKNQNTARDTSKNSSDTSNDTPSDDLDRENRPNTDRASTPPAQEGQDPALKSPDLIGKTLQKRKIECWDEFKIPWESFSTEDLVKLQKGVRGDKELVNNCVRRVFPETFEERKPDGQRLGNGYNTLADQLLNHAHNCNRPNKRPQSLNASFGVPPAKKKLLTYIKVGCPNWQPLAYPEGGTQVSLEETRNKLLEYDSGNYTPEDLKADFQKTFVVHRSFLNNLTEPVKAQDVYIAWPIIFVPEYQLKHFQLLTNKDLKVIKTNIRRDLEPIINEGTKDYAIVVDKDASEYEKIVTAPKVIFKQFKEEFGSLFVSFEECPETAADLGHPYILSIAKPEEKHDLIIDGHIISISAVFLDALQLLLTSFFVYNRPYPTSAAITLEFMQMRLLDIVNDEDFGRCKCEKEWKKANTFYRDINKCHDDLRNAAQD
ncbi:hypothetical protein QAD02_020604 [Eretmocerus hayati]|uniref:Uncharacterized protein n=1 Tax=Eretmocerus hayati TaxID=131215 RepID=A0ACC2PP63_9HYME|nr:hypothetical protein QAD02_020604 [Eretmocerus hayati]